MIDAIAVAGTAEQVRDGIQRRAGDFDHVALYSPSFTITPERIRQNMLDLVKVGASLTTATDRSLSSPVRRFVCRI